MELMTSRWHLVWKLVRMMFSRSLHVRKTVASSQATPTWYTQLNLANEVGLHDCEIISFAGLVLYHRWNLIFIDCCRMLPEPVLVSDWLRVGVFGNMVISRLSYQNICLILNECNCVFHALQISKESAEYMVEEYKRLRQRDSTGGLLLKCTNYGWHGNTLSWQHIAIIIWWKA